jgi:spore maturation protein SpmB
LLNIYSCIAVIEMLGLTGRAVTILALMCLISHNLFVETAVQKKTGSSLLAMVFVRLSASFAGAFILNLLLPADPADVAAQKTAETATSSFGAVMSDWFFSSAYLIAKIIILITLLMILQRLLQEFGIIRLLTKILKYPLVIVGLPVETAFLWIVANTLGLAYGAGVLIDEVDKEKLSRKHADILNYHIGISHSLLEDTALFGAIGVSGWWIVIPRILLAGVFVWLRRAFTAIYSKYQKPLDTL